MWYKLAAIILVFSGESLEILAEVFASKYTAGGNYGVTFFQMALLMTIGGILLVGGYMLGYLYFKNIWIIVVISLATLAIGEPLLAAFLFNDTPTTGSIIGLVLGVLALFSAVLIP